ncbi:hypothetical protein [Jannaschia sp. 2305UL9-9]|uniref:hypothetical protein n=1 Tax=Jannaschia sp. 2305UL9-9 TaxID=3121638 RepID=UPI0035297791
MSGPKVQVLEAGEAGDRAPVTAEPLCERCGQPFTRRRKDQRYCIPACQKKASRNAVRGARLAENAQRNRGHYDRASWLSYDVLRMSPEAQRPMIVAILEAASGPDAPLRNILLDPALLGADRMSPIGKLYPDIRSPSALNIAKMVDAFCREEWGVGTRDAILDDGKPARRVFAEPAPATEPKERPRQVEMRHIRPRAQTPSGGYDWRKLARAMRDPGWRRYFSQEEMDGFL